MIEGAMETDALMAADGDQIFRVYYRTDGKIWGHDTGPCDAPTMYPEVNFVVANALPDAKTQVIDPIDLQVRDMTDAERAMFNLPRTWDLICARTVELTNTDWREMRGPQEWLDYRQALRDITKAGEPAAMIDAWPPRPDGSDAIAHLRSVMV